MLRLVRGATPPSRLLERDPDVQIIPGVRLGRADELLTPAYWAMRCAVARSAEKDFVSRSGSLEEEVGFCLLGGYGVTLEVARAFFLKLQRHGAFQRSNAIPERGLLSLLNEPTDVNGRLMRYRFPSQRARRLHEAMRILAAIPLDTSDPIEFRSGLQSIPGIGPKTASWIARNWLSTDAVAILDIHILRAGWAMNLFNKECRLPRDYVALEHRFIMLAQALGLRASVLDAVIWTDMRKFGSRLVRQLAAA